LVVQQFVTSKGESQPFPPFIILECDVLVQIIEKMKDAGSAEFIELKVYRSSADPNLIVGIWQHSESVPIEPKGAIRISQNAPGGAIEVEFKRAVDCACRCGVPFVWINDTNALFPAGKRPEFRIVPLGSAQCGETAT
jgi:hypothetical protein